MSNDLVRERLIIEQKIKNEHTQLLLEGDIIVPDAKPDILVILQNDSSVCIDKTEVTGSRISFSGKLGLQILYLAKGDDKPVHSIALQNPINDFINIEDGNENAWFDVKSTITNIDYKIVNDRKINYKAVLDVSISGERVLPHDIITNITDIPENQLLKKTLRLNKSVENKEYQFMVKDELNLPTGKLNIREILQHNIVISNKDIKITNCKTSITGELIITLLYKGDSDDSLIEFVEHELPFNGVIEMSLIKDDMLCDVNIAVLDQYIQVKPNDDGEDRVIDIEVSIGATAKVSAQNSIEILEDAYCINKEIKITKTKIKYPMLVCRNKNQCPIKEVLTLDESCPDILQIFRVKGVANADDLKIMEDKVIVEGIIDTNVLYVAESDDTPLYSFNAIIPYRQVIETRGSNKNMDVELDITIDHIGFNMLSGREVEVRFLITFNTKITEERETSMITDVEIFDMDKSLIDNVASMTVYIVSEGDNLWQIAKKYNTRIDDLVNVNELSDENNLETGQKLLILKKV